MCTSRAFSAGGHLDMRLTVERGQGYVRAEQNKSDADPIGVIAIDSLFLAGSAGQLLGHGDASRGAGGP